MPKTRPPPSRKSKKRNLAAVSAKIRWQQVNVKKAVHDILCDLIDRVNEEKSSTKICKLIMNDIVDNVSKSFESESMSPPSCSFQHDYDFTNNVEFVEECERIDEHQLEFDVDHCDSTLSGFRIIDINWFLNKSLKIQTQHNKKCTGGQLIAIKEKREGLKSIFILKCSVCDKEEHLSNENLAKASILNKAFVWGTLSSGSSYTHSSELFSVLDIPVPSADSFYKIQSEFSALWKDSLTDIMETAGKEELESAIKNGDYESNTDGEKIGNISVYVDGGWSKRSYGHTYNAFSGVAVIIGQCTGKLLFLGVRNKYCSICARSERINRTPKQHTCFKNWSGSSSSMESDILVEGFNSSVETHKLQYIKFIGDGDSSVFSKIKEKVDYGLKVTKIECMNHVLKNYGKYLHKIKNDTKGVPLDARKLLSKDTILNLVESVQFAIYFNANDVENLKNDIRNSVYHVFRNHAACKVHLCTKVGDTAEDQYDLVITSGLHHHLYAAMNQLITKAHLLLDKETNNRAELFMSLLARFNMGKRLNLIQRNSFELRAYLSGLKYNEGHNWHIKPWEKLFGVSPGHHFQKFIMKQERNVLRKRENPSKKEKKLKPLKITAEKDSDYGPNIAEVHISDEELMDEVKKLAKRLHVTKEQQEEIFENTVGQFNNPRYVCERLHRLTASNFGAVVKRREWTSCNSLVKTILGHTTFASSSMEYGKANEGVAISLFQETTGMTVKPSGIFIDLNYGFLGASPDGVIDKNTIVEVKCCYKVASVEKDFIGSVKNKEVPYLQFQDGKVSIKRNHNYYYQIIGQLAISEATKCYFVVYAGSKNPLFIDIVTKDDALWKETMLPKLIRFYLECLGPEIILNRRQKNLKCLDPKYIQEAQIKREEEKSNKKNKKEKGENTVGQLPL